MTTQTQTKSNVVESKELLLFQTKFEKRVDIFTCGKNMKIGANVSILNLPPVKTCPNCKDCAKTCYAMWRNGSKTVHDRWERNLEMTKRADFVELATTELKYRCTPIVRFHESGDFYSEDYIDKCMELAIRNPQIMFYGYTKVKSALRLNALANMHIIYSLIDTPIGEVRNYGSKEYCEFLRDNYNATICPFETTGMKARGEKCMIDCKECLTCSSVCFVQHGRGKSTDTYSDNTLNKLKEVKGE